MVLSTISPDMFADSAIHVAPPDWAGKYRMSYEYKTDIITSGVGTEQRRAVRHWPRRYVSFTSHHTQSGKAYLDWLMARGRIERLVIPDSSKCVTTTAPLSLVLVKEPVIVNGVEIEPAVYETRREVTFESPIGQDPPYWMDALVYSKLPATVLLVDGDRIESRTVAGFSAGRIHFSDVSTNVFPSGTRIYPALFGWLQESPRTRRLTNDVVTLDNQFSVEPSRPSEIFAEPRPGDMVDGREIFMQRMNWRDGTEVSYLTPRDMVDYGFGHVSIYAKYDFPARVIAADYVGRDHAQTASVVDFFMRQRGRRGAFLLPTWENDIQFRAIAGSGLAILIDGLLFGMTYKDSTVFKRVMFRMADGRLIHRVVDYIDILPDTNTSVIWLKDRLPDEEITRTNVIGISWVLVARFASDRLDIDWLTDEVAQYSLSFQTLENFEL